MPHSAISALLPYLDRAALEAVTSEIVMLAGMTQLSSLTIPSPIEGIGWEDCFRRGLDRIAQLGNEALNAETPPH